MSGKATAHTTRQVVCTEAISLFNRIMVSKPSRTTQILHEINELFDSTVMYILNSKRMKSISLKDNKTWVHSKIEPVIFHKQKQDRSWMKR